MKATPLLEPVAELQATTILLAPECLPPTKAFVAVPTLTTVLTTPNVEPLSLALTLSPTPLP